MKNTLYKLNNKHYKDYTKEEIAKWKKMILELLSINPYEVENPAMLKRATKLAFIFFVQKLYNYSLKELVKILRLNEVWIKLTKTSQDKKLHSHFYWHAWYISLHLFKITREMIYAKKTEQYCNNALINYKNDIYYKININNNIIDLGQYIVKYNKDKKVVRKWIKITIRKLEDQIQIYQCISKSCKTLEYLIDTRLQLVNILEDISK